MNNRNQYIVEMNEVNAEITRCIQTNNSYELNFYYIMKMYMELKIVLDKLENTQNQRGVIEHLNHYANKLISHDIEFNFE